MKGPGVPGLPAFSKLFEHSADSVLVLSEDGRTILDVNPRAADLMAMERADLRGGDIADYLSRDLKELTAFVQAIHNHGVVWTDTFSLPGNGGAPKPVDVSASGFELPEGKFILLVIHEVLVPADEKERTAKAVAGAANYYLERMKRFEQHVLNVAAHDIRTPITPVLIQLALLEKSLGPLLDDNDKESIEVIRRNVKRLDEHVQSILLAASQSE